MAGVERLGYRINGAACPGAPWTFGISNSFSNNEVHSAMSGVNVWPMDRGFTFDRGGLDLHDRTQGNLYLIFLLDCVLINGFT